MLHYIAGKRLRAGRLTVVDATNVQPHARAALVEVAREHDVLPVAVVLDVPEALCLGAHRRPGRTATSAGRCSPASTATCAASLGQLAREGFRKVHVLRGVRGDRRRRRSRYEKLFNDQRELTGPFDIIGDMHGCRAELETLLRRLGYDAGARRRRAGRSTRAHPEGRTAVFVGDLVDRGPDSPGVLRLVMGMVARRARALRARQPRAEAAAQAARPQRPAHPRPGRDRSTQLAAEDAGVRRRGGGLHRRAGQPLRARRRPAGGRARRAEGGVPGPGVRPGAVASRCTARPPARPTSTACRCATRGPATTAGAAMVVYGHTPTPTPEWVNNTICLDTGCVFGGALTALRYPARELVVGAGASGASTRRCGRWPRRRRRGRADALDLADVTGRRSSTTGYGPGSTVAGRERRRRAGGDEPVRGRPALAAVAAADDGALLDLDGGGLPGAPGRGVRRLRARRRRRGWSARRSTWARGRWCWSAGTATARRSGWRRGLHPDRPAVLRRRRSTTQLLGPGARGGDRGRALGRAGHRLAAARRRAAAVVGQGRRADPRAVRRASARPRRAALPAVLSVLDAAAGRGLAVAELRDRIGRPARRRRRLHRRPTGATAGRPTAWTG